MVAALLAVAAAPAAAGERPALVVAVDEGDPRELARALRRATPADLDAYDDQVGSPTAGLRPIEVAAKRGDAAAVAALLKAGAQATARALELAAGRGQLVTVRRLRAAGAPGADLALTAAARAGKRAVVDFLLAGGATLEAADRDGLTPLLAATGGGHAAIAIRLLAAGADPRPITQRGESIWTLLIQGDKPARSPLFAALVKAKVPIDLANNDGETGLMVAAARGDRAWVTRFIAGGASPTARAADGRVALDYALDCGLTASRWSPSGGTCRGDIARALLAGPRPALGQPDGEQRTPLMRAIMTKDRELVRRLLALAPEDARVDRAGSNALHYAAAFADLETMKRLLAGKVAGAGAIDAVNQRGESPRSIAIDNHRPAIDAALVAAGAK